MVASLLLPVLPGAASARVRLREPQPIAVPRSLPPSALQRAILQGMAAKNWTAYSQRPGQILARLEVRRHMAIVRISYDEDSIRFQYQRSKNLDCARNRTSWEPGAPEKCRGIHPAYNRWVAALRASIEAAVEIEKEALRSPAGPPSLAATPQAMAPPPSPVTLPAAVGDPSRYGRYFALVIGDQGYAQLPPLRTPIADAEAIAELLHRDYGFAVTLLRDATRDQIVAALADFRHSLGEDDNLLIYYAGHGIRDDAADEGYWLPVDADRVEPTRWLSNGTVTALLRAMKARHVLVLADSCYAGTLTRGIRVPAVRDGDRETAARLRSRSALTSGGLEPVADGGPGEHSVFSKALLRVLGENRGLLDGLELFDRIRRPMLLNSHQTPTYGDIRFAGHEEGEFIFVRRGGTR